ncbi:MAG TPA: FAD-dependent oxidoreductase [Ktedonobacteraceae bacterium]
MGDEIQDLTIIGGGVMGLFTAYYASRFVPRVTILEKSYVGNKHTASFSYTRSIRNDYLDAHYARLAYEARQLWLTFQQNSAEPCIIECGCLNIAKENVTPALDETYAVQSFKTLTDLHLRAREFTRETLQEQFPQFSADLGRLDVEAGLLYVPAVTQALQTALRERGVRIVERVEIRQVEQQNGELLIHTSAGDYLSKKLVITAGLGTNEVIKLIPGNTVQFPLSPDRPSQCKYFIPPASKRAQFTSDVLPVFAYLDVGIYGHPIYEGRTPGVKIGFYNPPDVQTSNTHIKDVHSFVAECLPGLLDAEAVDVQDVDQCFYDLVGDDDFILGNLPGFDNIFVGVGWRGTGYKYAPWVGQTLTQLACQAGTVYDITRFTPVRFVPASA